MSLAILSQYLPKDIQKSLAKTNEAEWANHLMQHDKKGKDLAKLFKAVVTHTPWQENPNLKTLTEKCAALLCAKKHELSSKAKKHYKEALKLFQTHVAAPAAVLPKTQVTQENEQKPLYTAKIQKSKTSKTLKEILSVWRKAAKKKDHKAQKTESLPDDKKEIAEDSLLVVEILKESLKKTVTKQVPYIAYDENFKVHGIALKTFSKKNGSEVECIAANPDNVVIFGDEKATRGAGTAIIKHIVHDIKAKKQQGGLHLDAYISAVPFYEKLGFEKKPTKKEPEYTVPMVLRTEDMDALLQAKAATGIIKSKEPKAKALQHK